MSSKHYKSRQNYNFVHTFNLVCVKAPKNGNIRLTIIFFQFLLFPFTADKTYYFDSILENT